MYYIHWENICTENLYPNMKGIIISLMLRYFGYVVVFAFLQTCTRIRLMSRVDLRRILKRQYVENYLVLSLFCLIDISCTSTDRYINRIKRS